MTFPPSPNPLLFGAVLSRDVPTLRFYFLLAFGLALAFPAHAQGTPEISPAESAHEGELTDDDPPAERGGYFGFGSYGRVVVATDAEGRTASSSNIVSVGPRVDESTYAELEFQRHDSFGALSTRVVMTLGVLGPLFHFDGEFDASLAIRNLYAAVRGLGTDSLELWIGSRMVRGDDIYLLDVWPLDNLNLVGAGASYQLDGVGRASASLGWSRPRDPFQLQSIEVSARRGFGSDAVLLLDRPRLVAAARAEAAPWGYGTWGAKAVLYSEGHMLPEGERVDESGMRESLPSDRGYTVGGQLGGWWPDGSANVFVRYAHGLAAFDPLDTPFRDGAVTTTSLAREWMVGLSAHYDMGVVGLQAGALYRNFRDADRSSLEGHRLAEGALVLRPRVHFTEHLGLALDLSYQALQRSEIDVVTDSAVSGQVYKLGVIPFVSPRGRGSYDRPQLRILYVLTHRDEGARRLYPEGHHRASQSIEHFIGVGAEWWFDTTSYQ